MRVSGGNCIYCSGQPKIFITLEDCSLREDEWIESRKHPGKVRSYYHGGRSGLSVCPKCGWWTASLEYQEVSHGDQAMNSSIGAGTMLDFDQLYQREIIAEARESLKNDFLNARTQIHPRVFEDVVASLLRNFGYLPIITTYSRDGGIDIFAHREGKVHGVQVKRYKNSIEVENIRSLAGALVLEGITTGMFVTTSSFQKGCDQAVKGFLERGIEIELVDSTRLASALEMQTLSSPLSYEDIFYDPHSFTAAIGGCLF